MPKKAIRRAGMIAAAICVSALAACTSGTGSASSSGSGSGFNVTPFKQAATQFLKGSPSSYQGPASSPGAPANVKIWIMPCSASLSGCQTPAQYAEKAAKALGWHVTMFDGQGSPRTENTGLLDAVAAGANAIVTVSVSPDLVQQGLKAAADSVIADSGGKAHVLVMGDKEFPSVNLTQQAILAELAKCKTCTVSKVVYFTSDAVASSLAQQTVGYL